MPLNLPTVMALITWLVLGSTVLTMAIRWTQRTHPGCRRWALAGLLLVLSLFLLSLRSAPAWVHTIGADTGIALAAILYLEGAREFRGLSPRSWLPYAGGVVAIGAIAFSSYIVPNMNSRAAVISTFLAVVFTLVSVILLRGIPPAHRFGFAFTGSMFALCGATLLVRALYCWFGPPMSDRNGLSGIYGAFFFATVVEMSAFSLGLGLLVDERVISALNEVGKRASSAGTEVARLTEAQALLRDSEERFRFAQTAAAIGTFDWNIKTGVNTWTPQLEALYGLPPGGFARTQKAWEDLVHPDDRPRVLQRVAENYQTGSPAEDEWRVIWPDGSVHWIAGRWQVFKNATGERLRMMGVNIDVTARKEMEEAIRKSEERLRLAVKATNDAIWDFDLKAGTVSWNDTYSALFGRPGSADAWQFWIDHIHPEDRVRTVDDFKAAIGSAVSSWSSEYRFQRVNGEWAHIHDRAYIARDAAGNARRVIGAMQDLTEQKKAEAALRESEERFRATFFQAAVGIAQTGLDFRWMLLNDRFCEILGYSQTELQEKTFLEITHPDDSETSLTAVRQLLSGEMSSWSKEKRYIRKDGATVWGRVYLSLVRDQDNQPQYFIAVLADITERKQAEAALRESEERFRRVFEEGPLGLALIGEDHRFLKVNSALCQMVGYSEEELVRKTFVEITHPDDLRVDTEFAAQLFRREIPFYRIQKRYVKKTGEIIWINLTASIILGSDGEPLHGIAMVEDITEIKRSQEEASFRQKLESVGTLAGGIAHDFNNLLGAVQAQADLALAELEGGSSCKEELKAISDAAMRGSEIVRQLMIYAGKDSAVVGLVNLSKIVDEMLSLLNVSVTKHALIKADLDEDLPSILASAAQIRQIVMNLITNASDAIGDRDGVIRVITKRMTLTKESAGKLSRNLADGDYVQLEVSDTGCGMSPETLAKVFDPFFTTKSAGRGLGLAVVEGIVRSLGGAIDLTSEPDKGTTFRVLLRAEATIVINNHAETGDAETAVPRQHGTILVVEDEDYLRQAIVKMLNKTGFEALSAGNGSSAIDLLRADGAKIDVILLDMTIPGASSREVIAEAANVRPDMKVILTSAYSQEVIADVISQPQVRTFIRKPFQLKDLLKTLRSSLSS